MLKIEMRHKGTICILDLKGSLDLPRREAIERFHRKSPQGRHR